MSSESAAPSGDEAGLRHSAWIWIRAAAVLAAVWLVIQLLFVLQSWVGAVLITVLYVVFGSVVAFLAGPPARLLHTRFKFPPILSVLTVLTAGVLLVAFIVYLIVGPLIHEAEALAGQLPQFISRADNYIGGLRSQLTSHGLPVGKGGISSSFLGGAATGLLQGILTVAAGALAAVVDIIVTLVVAFWLIKDGEKLKAGFLWLMPGRMRTSADFALQGFVVVIGGYVRAQFLLALIIGTLGGAGSWVIGVPYPLVVGIAAGVFELIPLLGPFAGGAVAILLALTKSWQMALITLGWFLVIHGIEGYLLAPRIQARFVRIHPVLALLALFAGIEVGGFLGALVAVPIASLLALYLRTARGEISAGNPDVFRNPPRDGQSHRRRRQLLGEFRFFRRRGGTNK